MKIPVLIVIVGLHLNVVAQITSPQIRAAFGVDADLRSHYFNSFVQLGNDDWFNQRTGTLDTGRFVIDTSGAAALLAQYASVPSSRRLPFYRNMRYPQYSVVNNRLLLDAIMIRDYHGDDSTVFSSGGNKNGDNPNDWNCPVSQGIPDKNDILDMFLHIRRAGPTPTDSLWMFGAMSLDNTTGNRYFDFEMYQTDLYYDRPSRRFYNWGPDMGHTSWQLDAAGNILVPGDIIFNAQYQSSSLTSIQARIWVHYSTLSITPANFSWSGEFDGAYNGAPYGYASIVPKTAGTYYTGLQCGNNTWGGPFGVVLQSDAVVTNYTGGQFMEYSVNLTKLGLDPVNLMGGNVCGMPFRRMLVKTRASSSFTAELKDFVGPFDLFLAPRVSIQTNSPNICDTGSIAEIEIANPSPSSVYQWSTTNGNIVGSTTGTRIFVDTPGVYMVNQYLQAGCSIYATDALQIMSFGTCVILNSKIISFLGQLNNSNVRLDWKINNPGIDFFEVERSEDGINFYSVRQLTKNEFPPGSYDFRYHDDISQVRNDVVYYRISYYVAGEAKKYSPVVRIVQKPGTEKKLIIPNPVRNVMQIHYMASTPGLVTIQLHGLDGRMTGTFQSMVQAGMNTITLDDVAVYPAGVYQVVLHTGKEILSRQVLLTR